MVIDVGMTQGDTLLLKRDGQGSKGPQTVAVVLTDTNLAKNEIRLAQTVIHNLQLKQPVGSTIFGSAVETQSASTVKFHAPSIDQVLSQYLSKGSRPVATGDVVRVSIDVKIAEIRNDREVIPYANVTEATRLSSLEPPLNRVLSSSEEIHADPFQRFVQQEKGCVAELERIRIAEETLKQQKIVATAMQTKLASVKRKFAEMLTNDTQ